MGKTVVIQIAGNPQYARKPSPSRIIVNPATALPTFGTFPPINTQDADFGGGPIYLRYGKHIGPSQGWGFEHIWQARFPECLDQSSATPKVVALISSIIVPGAAIHYEFGIGSANRRASVFRSGRGVVVVEERKDGSNKLFYGIVTVFSALKTNGSKIGAI